jgi:hypothetical protein
MSDKIQIHPRLGQLDELISDLYNAVYAKTGNYGTGFFEGFDMGEIRFKFSDYNLDTVFENTPIIYSYDSPTGIREDVNDPNSEIKEIIFKRQGTIHPTLIKIIPYDDKNTVNILTNPINVNQLIRTVLSELVLNERTTNIALPVINIDVKGSDLSGYDSLKDRIDPKKFYNIQITEKFYGIISLEKFLSKYSLELRVIKTILYQIIDLLYQINLSYPNFRHNQLIPSKIDCYLRKIDGIIVPELKLNNFYLSEIQGTVNNDYINTLNIPDIRVPYFDLYTFLNWFHGKYIIDINRYPELVKFFEYILPEKIRSDKNMYLTIDLWEKLSDDEREEFKIKNLRNNQFFTVKDSISGNVFIESKQDDELTGGKSENLKKSDDYSDVQNDVIIDSNKKSLHNDIDNMSDTKKDKKIKESEKNTKKTTSDNDSENSIIQSRVININEKNYNYSKHGKQKTYHGTRKINVPSHNVVNDTSLNELLQPSRVTGDVSYEQNMMMNQMPNQMQNQAKYDGSSQKMNSIGQLLGINNNDLRVPDKTNYNQIAQQLSQQYGSQDQMNQYMGQNQMMNQMPNQMMNQMPNQMMNPMSNQMMNQMPNQMPNQMFGQMPNNSADNDMMMKYLMTTGQMPNGQQNLGQMDQQNMQFMPNNMNQFNQMGGAGMRKNPFFFQ